MSRKSWVGFSHCFSEGVHREESLQRTLLLKAISVANVAALSSLGKTPTILVRLFTSSKSRSSILVVRSLAWWLPG
jgi:hypothetical protein